MILGIGTDITDIRRIEQSLARFGARFEERIFTPAERAKAKSRESAGQSAIAATYAKRFAAKEACAKALGTGMNSGVHWHDMEVTNLPSGRPGLQLSGKALEILTAMLPPGTRPAIHVSLTDDWPTAQAFLVIEALPLP